MFGVGMPMTPELGAAIGDVSTSSCKTMRPGAGGAYCNFVRAAVRRRAIFDAEICDRLREVKREWDPDGLIRANHARAPLAAA